LITRLHRDLYRGLCRTTNARAKRRVVLLNYADDRFGHKGAIFRQSQQAMSASALAHGIDFVVSWNWEMLASTTFYRDHQKYLERPYKLNGFVFKPYLTLRTLEELNEGDILIYYDSGDGGHRFDTSVKPLVDMCVANGGTLIQQWGESNQKWTKRDCFFFMGLDDPEFHNATAMQATWFVFEKNAFTMEFVREYLRYTLDERIASYQNDRVCGLPDLPGFVENRGDQSVLSLLAHKYRLRTFRGAGGKANRVIGNFIRWYTVAGRCNLLLQSSRRKLGVKLENFRHKIRQKQI
jgi:hypothetical protein